jgi:diguanylate cyclase (GGDEF)-like protein
VAGGPPIRFTTSVGVAALQPGDATVQSLLERADRALYAAKAAGRDRVVSIRGADRAPPPA